jgi:hypothetical protein
VTTSAAGNATQDIGFTGGGDLNTSSLASFIGSNTGYTNILYDQMSHSNASAVNTVPHIPIIVNAGTNNTLNGHATSLCAGFGTALTADCWIFSLSTTINQPLTVAICLRVVSNAGSSPHFTDGTGPRILVGEDGTGPPPKYQQYAGGTPQSSATSLDTTTTHTLIAIFNGASSELILDGTVILGPASSGTDGLTSVSQYIGSSNTPSSGNWYIPEYLVFSGSLGSTDQATIRSSWQSYWGAA